MNTIIITNYSIVATTVANESSYNIVKNANSYIRKVDMVLFIIITNRNINATNIIISGINTISQRDNNLHQRNILNLQK